MRRVHDIESTHVHLHNVCECVQVCFHLGYILIYMRVYVYANYVYYVNILMYKGMCTCAQVYVCLCAGCVHGRIDIPMYTLTLTIIVIYVSGFECIFYVSLVASFSILR